MLWPSRDPSREIASALVLLGVMATFGATDSVWAQEIPAHPRQLSFEGLDFEPPASERHRHTLANGALRGRTDGSVAGLTASGFVFVAPQAAVEVDLQPGDGDEVGPVRSVQDFVEGF